MGEMGEKTCVRDGSATNASNAEGGGSAIREPLGDRERFPLRIGLVHTSSIPSSLYKIKHIFCGYRTDHLSNKIVCLLFIYPVDLMLVCATKLAF
jgi:hypothetical protein